jgi:hypothetical protein
MDPAYRHHDTSHQCFHGFHFSPAHTTCLLEEELFGSDCSYLAIHFDRDILEYYTMAGSHQCGKWQVRRKRIHSFLNHINKPFVDSLSINTRLKESLL